MPTLEQLVIELMTEGGAQVQADMKRTAGAVTEVGDKSEQAGQKVQSFADRLREGRMSLVEMAFVAQNAVNSIGQITRMLMSFSGVKIAAEYQRVAVSFTALLGSQSKADKLLETLKGIGESTPFETLELVKFGRQLISTGSSAEETARQIQAFSKLGMTAGMDTAGVGEIVSMMSGMRNRPHLDAEQIGALASRGVDMKRIVNAATGRSYNRQQAIGYVSAQRGEKAFNTLLTGIEKLYGNSDGTTLLGTMENLGEVFANIMLPTGRLLLPVVGGIATAFTMLGQAVGKVNELTGGGAGLIFLVTGLYKAKGFLAGSIRLAYDRTRELIVALTEYGTVAGAAATATRANATARATGTAMAISTGAAGASATATGAAAGMGFFRRSFEALRVMTRIGGAKGFGLGIKNIGAEAFGMLRGIGPKAAGFAKTGAGANIIGLAVDLIGNAAGDWMKDGAKAGSKRSIGGSMLKGAATWVGYGSMGNLLGPEIGIPAMIVGGVIGAVKGYFDGKNEKADPVAENTKKMVGLLDNISGKIVGGGERSNISATNMQLEYAIARAIAGG